MSKRHQSSRRKSYGRRQHEVRERQDRIGQTDAGGHGLEEWGDGRPSESYTFADPSTGRSRYAVGD